MCKALTTVYVYTDKERIYLEIMPKYWQEPEQLLLNCREYTIFFDRNREHNELVWLIDWIVLEVFV